VVFVLAVVVGLVFGGGDQYLGAINANGLWTVSLSLLSAPWLVLPFAFGCSQLRTSRAAAIGLVATMSALLGYFLMIMGPFEGGQWTMNLREIHGLLVSNAENILGGLVTGPLYGRGALLGTAGSHHRGQAVSGRPGRMARRDSPRPRTGRLLLAHGRRLSQTRQLRGR
jgi:hypothetical protein